MHEALKQYLKGGITFEGTDDFANTTPSIVHQKDLKT